MSVFELVKYYFNKGYTAEEIALHTPLSLRDVAPIYQALKGE